MSPYESFALIERNKLKKVTSHTTILTSFIANIQSYMSLLSDHIGIFPKFKDRSVLIFTAMQYQDFSASLASSISDSPIGYFPIISEPIARAHRYDFMNFRNSGPYPGYRPMTELVINCELGSISPNISNQNYISKTPNNNFLELTL
jgi:hypothetical protein